MNQSFEIYENINRLACDGLEWKQRVLKAESLSRELLDAIEKIEIMTRFHSKLPKLKLKEIVLAALEKAKEIK